MEYNFKDKYTFDGKDMIFTNPSIVRYFTASKLSGGTYTRANPSASTTVNVNYVNILDSGYHPRVNGYFYISQNVGPYHTYIIGTDRYTTKITPLFYMDAYSNGGRSNLYLENLRISGGTLEFSSSNRCSVLMRNCIYEGSTVINYASNTVLQSYVYGSILKALPTFIYNPNHVYNNNSYLSATIGSYLSSTRYCVSGQAFESCKIDITQDIVNATKDKYFSFDKCSFRFPNDTDYIALKGTVPEELRADFISRATANGIALPTITEYDYTDVPLGRWLFTVDNSNEAIIYSDSDINKFENTRGIRFGFSNDRPVKIRVSNAANLPNSINPNNPNSGNVVFNEGSISFPNSLDITTKNDFYVTSNIFPLGAIRKIDKILCPNNLMWQYGFLLDAEKNLDLDNPILPDTSRIDNGVSYLVRSSDGNFATAVYNGKTYSTSLSLPRTNIIVGANGVHSFNVGQGNPVLYEIVDNRQYQSIQVRIVNKIPADKITDGSLQDGYWYLVEHDTDQSNATDYVTYKGVKYYAGSSFLANTDLSFSKSGNIHLRRCWSESYDNPNEEITDQAFWQYEQKPKWINVNPEDMYCLMKNNNGSESEMQTDSNGAYITTGHPDFYNMVLGTGGISLPKYPIKGAYIQLRIPMSTLNIM